MKQFKYYEAKLECGDTLNFRVTSFAKILKIEVIKKWHDRNQIFRLLVEEHPNVISHEKLKFKIIGNEQEISKDLKYISSFTDSDFGFDFHICLDETV